MYVSTYYAGENNRSARFVRPKGDEDQLHYYQDEKSKKVGLPTIRPLELTSVETRSSVLQSRSTPC